jgi:hypothetical protein
MIADLLDPDGLQMVTFKSENQPVGSRQSYRPLPLSVLFKGVTPETRQRLEFLNVVRDLDNIDTLLVVPSDLLPVSPVRFPFLEVSLFQFLRPESDFHLRPRSVPAAMIFTPRVKIIRPADPFVNMFLYPLGKESIAPRPEDPSPPLVRTSLTSGH